MNASMRLDVQSVLAEVRRFHTQADIAKALSIDVRTVRRWQAGDCLPPSYVVHALRQLLPQELPFDGEPADFTFIDLFAGIGGIRQAFEAVGGRCVFTSEWDSYAQKTYVENHRHDAHALNGDITQVGAADIPAHDVLLAGFPCQPFSIAGVSKKNALGRAHGFQDATQGTLFFDVARIIDEKRPQAFLLENVKNLLSHDKGRTFDVIRRTLTEELGYHIHWRVIDGAHFTPQHRERILIAGFRELVAFEKAGIFRAGRPAICSDPMPPASLVAHAEAIGARLWVTGRVVSTCVALASNGRPLKARARVSFFRVSLDSSVSSWPVSCRASMSRLRCDLEGRSSKSSGVVWVFIWARAPWR